MRHERNHMQEPRGPQSPPRQGGKPYSEKRVLRGMVPRSVDSERASRVIEPREEARESRCRQEGRRQHCAAGHRAGSCPVLTGVIEQGAFARAPRELLGRSRRFRMVRYVPREGNEAGSEDRREVGALHCTDEAGEPTRGTLRRESGAGMWNRSEERWERHRARKPSQRNSNG